MCTDRDRDREDRDRDRDRGIRLRGNGCELISYLLEYFLCLLKIDLSPLCCLREALF